MDKKLFYDWLRGVADIYNYTVDPRAPSILDEPDITDQLAIRKLHPLPHQCGDCGRKCADRPKHVHRLVQDPLGDFWATRCLECSRYRDPTGEYTIPGKVTNAALRFYWNRARTNK